MADKQESALTQQSDCKWVRALDSNGNSILISKEDLASVVGGLIGVATSEKNGLMSKSYVWKKVSTGGEKWIQFKFSNLFMGYIHLLARTSTPFLDLNIAVSNWNERTIRVSSSGLSSYIEGKIKMKKNDDNTMNLYVKAAEIQYIILTNYGSFSYDGIMDTLPDGVTSLTNIVGAS